MEECSSEDSTYKKLLNYFTEDMDAIVSVYSTFLETNDETGIYEIGPFDYVSSEDSTEDIAYYCWTIGKYPCREIRFYLDEANNIISIEYKVFDSDLLSASIENNDIYDILVNICNNVFLFDQELEEGR